MSYSPEQVRSGGWIVAIYKAIAVYDVDDPAFDDYEATINAAKAAEFLSSIRSLGRIDARQYETYRRLARIKPNQSIDVLRRLEKVGGLEAKWDTRTEPPSVNAVEASVTSKAGVFATTAKFFEAHSPTAKARAAIEVLEEAVHFPVPRSSLVSALVAKKYSPTEEITRLSCSSMSARIRGYQNSQTFLIRQCA